MQPSMIEQDLDPADSVTLAIDGLKCGGCVARLERALAAAHGVRDARVNLAAENAQIDLAPGSDAEAAVAAAEAAGFGVRRERASVDAAADAARRSDAERAAWRTAAIAGLLTAPVVFLEMGAHMSPALRDWIDAALGRQLSWAIQAVFATAVLVWPARVFFVRGAPALLRGAPEMNALVALGAGSAWLYSMVALLAPAALPETSRVVYFEAAAVIATFILLGRALEIRARGAAGDAIRSLLALQPDTARVVVDGVVVERRTSDVRVGDVVRVAPGDRAPVDGVVVAGASFLDEALITGEPEPVARGVGDPIVGGSVNGHGAFDMRATAVGADAALGRIAAMVAAAQSAKAPLQRLVDRVAGVFAPIVIAIAVLALFVHLGFGQPLSVAVAAAVSVLVVACPCALGLATPTSIMVGMGRAARLGVLFRSGEAMQRLAAADLIAFDKTGTLTEGAPSLAAVEVAPPFERSTVLAAAAAVERWSEHPIARAIARAAPEPPSAQDFRARPGLGAEGRVDGRHVAVGSARWMASRNVDTARFNAAADAAARDGATPVFVEIDGAAAGLLTIADRPKPTAAAAVSELRAAGLDVAMISGDDRRTAVAIAAAVGVAADAVRADARPEEKAELVGRLRAGGRRVAFVGDGVNDAPALASAEVGVAIGAGADVAVEAAEIVLVSGDPRAVWTARRLARATVSNIRQNLGWAFGYNILLIPVAAGALQPFWGVSLSPMLAAFAMAASSVCVVGNALRLNFVTANGRFVTANGREGMR